MRVRKRCLSAKARRGPPFVATRSNQILPMQILSGRSALAQPQKNKLRVVVASPVEFAKAVRRGELRFGGFFHHDQSVRRQPASGARGVERGGGHSLAVGRVEESE